MGNHLAIQVAADGLHCVVSKNGIFSTSCSLSFNSSDEASIKDQITNEFETRGFFTTDFDDISLSWSSNKTTLIPNAVFSESDSKSLFELCFGASEHGIDYNRISELSIVNVYEIPDWVKRYFVLKFPRIIVQHEGSFLLRNVMNENSFKLKLSIVTYNSFFLLMISKHNELIFYSTFDYQSHDDILYHTSFVLQQKELLNEKGNIDLIAGVGSMPEVLTRFTENAKRISELKLFEVNNPDNYIIKAHQLCV